MSLLPIESFKTSYDPYHQRMFYASLIQLCLVFYRELAFFFPEYQVPQVAKPGSRAHPSRIPQHGVQRTLALIRPDALVDKKGLYCNRDIMCLRLFSRFTSATFHFAIFFILIGSDAGINLAPPAMST